MKNWQDFALELASNGMRYCEIAKMVENEYNLSNMYNKVKCFLYKKKKKGKIPSNKEKRVIFESIEPNKYDTKWDGIQTIRFGLIGDTHLGSKYAQITHLHDFYNRCKAEGITDIYHTGDITDGLKMRPGHDYELYAPSGDQQLADVVKNYPRIEGVTTHFITGNHDASLWKHVGLDIGKLIALRRPDMNYLGRDWAVINLTPNCTLELRHPWDGGSYAISYRPQKMIEAMEADSKPSVLAIGHYHKQLEIFYRNIHCFLPGCFQGQTPFSRGKGLLVAMGGYIMTLKVDKNGTIVSIIPEFIPYYKSITDDYKNYI